MYKIILITLLTLFVVNIVGFCQQPVLNAKQICFRKSALNFITSIVNNTDAEIIKPSFFKTYLYISDPFLDSTTESGKEYNQGMQYSIIRVKEFLLKNKIDDFDLAPIEYFKKDTVFAKYIREEEMQKYFKNIKENVLAFYQKSNPEQPIILIRFEPNTNKVYTWLTFNPYSIIFFLYPEKPTI